MRNGHVKTLASRVTVGVDRDHVGSDLSSLPTKCARIGMLFSEPAGMAMAADEPEWQSSYLWQKRPWNLQDRCRLEVQVC